MTTTASDTGVGEIYNFWLGLIPHFFAQLGTGLPQAPSATSTTLPGLAFPADQVARAANMTLQSLQALAQAYTPMLQAAGAPGLLGQWAAAMPFFAGTDGRPTAGATAPSPPPVPNPWFAAMSLLPKGTDNPLASAPGPAPDLASALTPWATAMSQSFATGFDRTFGALTDALGLSPMRKLQEAWQQIVSASVAQNQARASYAALVQTAFSAGFDGLLHKLAEKGHKGERVDSVLALLRLWAIETENAVHRVLQSEQGMAATAAVARSGLAYRRNVQRFAAIIADALDMTTRRDLDEAFREIQELKREVRKLRPPVAVGTTSRKAQGTVRKRTGT